MLPNSSSKSCHFSIHFPLGWLVTTCSNSIFISVDNSIWKSVAVFMAIDTRTDSSSCCERYILLFWVFILLYQPRTDLSRSLFTTAKPALQCEVRCSHDLASRCWKGQQVCRPTQVGYFLDSRSGLPRSAGLWTPAGVLLHSVVQIRTFVFKINTSFLVKRSCADN